MIQCPQIIMRIALTFFLAIALLSHVSRSQYSCPDYKNEADCIKTAGTCAWLVNSASPDGICNCASAVKLDILFAIDASGSIGLRGFQIQKQFLKTLVTQGVNEDSKLGFVMFSTEVNFSRTIQVWETGPLENYVSGLYWDAGYTNTQEVVQQAIFEFDGGYRGSAYQPQADRQQILMMVTDGNPCLPESMGGCPHSVCQYASQIKAQGIRVIIIGVGEHLNNLYVQCLTQSPDDFIPVANFTAADFDSIMGSLSAALCPVALDFKVTEVKAMRKPPAWTGAQARLTRFIEFYNNGIAFSLQDISATGFITMAAGPDVAVEQGQYVVFYDAADLPADAGTGPGMPSCHLCGDDCDLSQCGFVGEVGNAGYCWCGNSVYVACDNQQDSDCSQSMNNDAGSTAHNGCSQCQFNNAMDRTNWNIQFNDQAGKLIDGVDYTGAPEWIETSDGFSYELISKGLDNDYGANWAESCSQLGTPGADPAASCVATCLGNSCGGGNTCLPTGVCDCSTTTGYYPQCSSPSVCTKCLQVPQVGDCDVFWTKNGTTRRATYNWTLAERDSSTRYVLSTYGGSGKGAIKVIGQRGSAELDDCDTCLWQPIYATTDYWPFNDSYGGYVQVAIDQCQTWKDSNDVEHETCDVYYGAKTMCNVKTSPPTLDPTPAPTPPPTRDPTPIPTPPPTHPCPEVFWVGGTQQKICRKHDRCNCFVGNKDCCLLDPIFEGGTYDENRGHHQKYDCKLDVEKARWDADSESAAGSSPGYLLTTQKHYFAVDILPEGYDCALNIFWRFEWTRTDCTYDPDDRRRRRRLLCNSDDNSLEQAGLAIDVTSGWLHPDDGDDEKNLQVPFTVSRIKCEDGDDDDDTRRRRLAKDDEDCFNNVAIYGKLVIVNATSQCRPDCYDPRIYPMEIPVWYNYADAFYIPPGQEKELPPWLWWIVAALVIFLCCLALLLYKYWWKSQATGAALDGVQKDLDQAVYVSEVGFGNGLQGDQVGFNRLATGFNPNAPAGNGVPNRPPDQDDVGKQFIRPNVERPVFKQQYGPHAGNLR